jgi:aldehyde dehydrogenase (NAD+)
MEDVRQNYIGGTWVPASASAPNVNPSNLKDVIAYYARGRPAEAEAAVAAAKAAFAAYSRSTPQERYDGLKKISGDKLRSNARPTVRSSRPGSAALRPRG